MDVSIKDIHLSDERTRKELDSFWTLAQQASLATQNLKDFLSFVISNLENDVCCGSTNYIDHVLRRACINIRFSKSSSDRECAVYTSLLIDILWLNKVSVHEVKSFIPASSLDTVREIFFYRDGQLNLSYCSATAQKIICSEIIAKSIWAGNTEDMLLRTWLDSSYSDLKELSKIDSVIKANIIESLDLLCEEMKIAPTKESQLAWLI